MHTTQTRKAKSDRSHAQRSSAAPMTSAAAQRAPAYARRMVQTKVAVGPAHDSFEQEADSVAQRVASGGDVAPESISSVAPAAHRAPKEEKKKEEPKPVQKAPAKPEEKKPETSSQKSPAAPEEKKPVQKAQSAKPEEKKPVQKAEARKPEEKKPVQKAEAKNAPGSAGQQAAEHTPASARDSKKQGGEQKAMSDAAEQAIANKGPGRPLNPATQKMLSERMSMDLSHVRIHDDPAAHEACRALHARAFTHGSDIWLGPGETDTDINLMAHEVTHVVQQTDHVHRKAIQRNANTTPNASPNADGEKPPVSPIQRAVVQRQGPPPPPPASPSGGAGGVKPGPGEAKIEGKTIKIPTLAMPAFKLARHAADYPSPLQIKESASSSGAAPTTAAATPSAGSAAPPAAGAPAPGGAGDKRDTKQIKNWKNAVSAGVLSQMETKLKGAQPVKSGTSNRSIYFLKSHQSDFHLFGDKAGLASEAELPYWDRHGKERLLAVDHKLEDQLGGEDAPANYELLDASANSSSGPAISNQLTKSLSKALKPYVGSAAGSQKLWDSTPTLKALRGGGYTVIFEKLLPGLGVSGDPNEYWSLDEVTQGKHLQALKVMTPAEVTKSGLQGSDNEIVIYTAAHGGTPRRIPFKKGAGSATVSVPNFYKGFNLTSVLYTPSEKEGSVVGLLGGELRTNAPYVDAGKKQLTFDLRQATGIGNGAYVNDLAVEAALKQLAQTLKIKPLSPVVFHTAGIDDARGLFAVGQVLPTVPLFQNLGIDLVLEGDDIRLRKLFDTGSLAVPKPFSITSSTLEVFASTKQGFGVDGEIQFEIDRLGKGSLSGKAATGTGGGAIFAIAGELTLDPKIADGVTLKAWYKKDGDEYDYGLSGNIVIKEGKIKGIKSATISAAYGKGKFTADGSAQLAIPGLKQAGLHIDYDEKQGLTIGGDVQLEKSKFIQSGSGSVTLKKKEGEDYHVSGSGTVVPNVPGVSVAVAFAFEDDAFSAQATVGYEKGMLKGSVTVGVTNRPVGDDGKPGDGPPKDLKVYGGGSVTIKLAPWLQGTAGIKIKPNGEIEMVGKIGLPSSLKIFDEKKLEKNIFKINIDIPIIGLSAGGQNVGIFASIGGGLDLSAGIGPGELQDVGVEVTYNPDHEEDTHILGGAKLHIPAHAGLRLFVRGALGAGIPLVSARAGLEIGAELGLVGALDASVQVDWTPSKGLVIDAKGSAFVEPKLKFDITGFVTVDLDLLLTTINLYEKKWQLAAFEWGSGLRFGVEFPIHYEEGKPFNVSLDDLKFTVPDINPGEVLGGLIKKIAD